MGRVFVFLAAIALLSILVDLYAYQGIRQLTANIDPTWRKVTRIAFWAPTVITFLFFLSLYFGMGYFMEKKTYGYFFFVTGFSFLFFIPKLIFLGFHFADDIMHAARWLINRTASPAEADPAERMTRIQFFNQVGLGASALVFGSLLYGLTRGKYAYRIVREQIGFEDLPKSFDGLRIVHISDAHLGSFLDNSFEEVQAGLQMINDLKPDLILFTGDMVNNFAHEADPWIPYFQKLEARLGKFSVLGNHDYGDYVYRRDEQPEQWESNLKHLKQVQAAMGFRLLLNEHITIGEGDDQIHLIGMENWGRGRFSKYGDLKKAMNGLPENGLRLLMSHDPTHWEDQVMSRERIHLTLSGHTHGAQMGLEAPMLNIKFSPSPWFGYKRWAGLYEEAGQYLYVNRGFGFLGFPGRVGMPPEITLIVIESQRDKAMSA